MVRMAIAADMLAALGGAPKIRALDPGYPCHGLPGGAEPDLRIGLAKLSRAQLANFMRLESPVDLLPRRAAARDTRPSAGSTRGRSRPWR